MCFDDGFSFSSWLMIAQNKTKLFATLDPLKKNYKYSICFLDSKTVVTKEQNVSPLLFKNIRGLLLYIFAHPAPGRNLSFHTVFMQNPFYKNSQRVSKLHCKQTC